MNRDLRRSKEARSTCVLPERYLNRGSTGEYREAVAASSIVAKTLTPLGVIFHRVRIPRRFDSRRFIYTYLVNGPSEGVRRLNPIDPLSHAD